MVFGWPYFEVQCRIASTNPVRTHVAGGLVWNRRYLCDTNAADFGDVLMSDRPRTHRRLATMELHVSALPCQYWQRHDLRAS